MTKAIAEFMFIDISQCNKFLHCHRHHEQHQHQYTNASTAKHSRLMAATPKQQINNYKTTEKHQNNKQNNKPTVKGQIPKSIVSTTTTKTFRIPASNVFAASNPVVAPTLPQLSPTPNPTNVNTLGSQYTAAGCCCYWLLRFAFIARQRPTTNQSPSTWLRPCYAALAAGLVFYYFNTIKC